jgi:hypothetical protein
LHAHRRQANEILKEKPSTVEARKKYDMPPLRERAAAFASRVSLCLVRQPVDTLAGHDRVSVGTQPRPKRWKLNENREFAMANRGSVKTP